MPIIPNTLDKPVARLGKGSPAVPTVKEHQESMTVKEEGDFSKALHDESEDKVVEEVGDVHQLCYGKLLLLNKQLIVIKDSVTTHIWRIAW